MRNRNLGKGFRGGEGMAENKWSNTRYTNTIMLHLIRIPLPVMFPKWHKVAGQPECLLLAPHDYRGQVLIRSFPRLTVAGLLVSMLTGCTPNGAQTPTFRIDEATNPMAQVPANHFERWKPQSGTPEAAPDLSATASAARVTQVLVDGRDYDLVDLIDLGLRNNPTTRSTWEQARAAAAGLGISESAWLPSLTAQMTAGYWRYPFPAPAAPVALSGTTVYPTMNLNWTIFDYSRSAQIDSSIQQLFAANHTLNRNHQDVAFKIQQAFYGVIAAKARVEAGQATLKQSTRNADSIRKQLENGLATQPEYLMAAQDQARAAYDLQGLHGFVMEKEAELAEAMGLRPDMQLHTVSLDKHDLPSDSEHSADDIIDTALQNRPDLAARLANLRAKDAEIRKAEANYWPQLSLALQGGWKLWDYHNAQQNSAQQGYEQVTTSQPLMSAGVTMNWSLFEGFSGVNSVNVAEAKRNAAQAEFDALQLKIMKDVWKSYADFKTSIRKREFAVAMLKASEKSYEGALKSYEQGITTVIELITAERNLAQARYTEIDSRSSLLIAAASLVYASGIGQEAAASY